MLSRDGPTVESAIWKHKPFGTGWESTTHSESVGQFLAAAQNESILIGSHFYFKFGNTLAQLERGVAELAYAHSSSSIVFNLRSRAAATKAPDCFFFKLNLRGVERVKIKSHDPFVCSADL